jgi:hypothetical protein
MAANDDVRRATEGVYQALVLTDTSATTYLTGHAWTVTNGRWSKGGVSNATIDVALQTELLA